MIVRSFRVALSQTRMDFKIFIGSLGHKTFLRFVFKFRRLNVLGSPTLFEHNSMLFWHIVNEIFASVFLVTYTYGYILSGSPWT